MLCGWASGLVGVWLARRWRPEDKPRVVAAIGALIEAGEYPPDLWGAA
jgi:hypothetical protein